jgi:hypothetical protein
VTNAYHMEMAVKVLHVRVGVGGSEVPRAEEYLRREWCLGAFLRSRRHDERFAIGRRGND